jgi:glycoprotein endo-alpha-1,2-mannosidase
MELMTRRTLLSIVPSAAGLSLCRPLSGRSHGHEVLAFYYGWYANPDVSGGWAHWPEGVADEPQAGRYDSHDPKAIQAAFGQAQSAGITGVIVSWWRPGDFQDRGMPLILAAAEQAGLKVTIYYEVAKPRQSPTPQATEDDLLDILARYANHLAWLRSANQPVVFVYSRALNELHLTGWERVISEVKRRHAGGVCFVGDEISTAASKVFDGVHTYNPTSQTANMNIDEIRAWARATYPRWVRTAGGRISCVTVIPGYNDTKLKRPGPRPTTDRHGGETYRILWQEAIAAQPNWILITSWNEWHEGSEIEPSKENGDRELNATGEFARRFVGG